MERVKREEAAVVAEEVTAEANNAEEVAAEMAEGAAVTEASVLDAAAGRVNGK